MNHSNSRKFTITMEPMVKWFSPLQLIQTGMRTLVAGLFGSFVDRRDIQAALHLGRPNPDAEDADYSHNDEIWIDYLADTGDGWNPTYAMAYLLAQPQLKLNGDLLPQANLLILGGDQVYPTPANDGYNTRFVGPYRCAYPEGSQQTEARTIYAIPGNHDWYDGLNGFTRLFCSQAPIGAWQTQQSRSYFCLKLPHGWWLWGIDIQLDSDIDHEQLLYFVEQAKKLQPGDQVILCTAEPCWIDESRRREEKNSLHRKQLRYRNLSKVEDLIPAHAQLALTLAGDLHHYARYQPQKSGPQRITCGGGGAYLLGTQELPERLFFQETAQEYSLAQGKTFPSPLCSKLLRWKALFFPFKNYSFCLFLGFYYSLLGWLIQSNSSTAFADLSCFDLLKQFAHQPSAALLLLLAPLGFTAFTHEASPRLHRLATVAGFLHGCAHLVLAWGVTKLSSSLIPLLPAGWGNLPPDHPLALVLLGLPNLLLGGLLGGFLLGAWLIFASQKALGWHEEHVFSCLGTIHYKSFLRLHISNKGLTIYAIGLRKTPTQWQSQHATRSPLDHSWLNRLFGGGQQHWDVPLDQMKAAVFQPKKPMHAHLIEKITLFTTSEPKQ